MKVGMISLGYDKNRVDAEVMLGLLSAEDIPLLINLKKQI